MTEMSANSFSGICWPPGVATRMLPIASGLSRYCCSKPHDEVELLLLLHHLGGDVAADGGLDQAVDVGDVEAVAGDLGAVDLDRQAGLAELLHQRDVADAAHVLQHALDRLALRLERIEVGAEDLHRQRALQARSRPRRPRPRPAGCS